MYRVSYIKNGKCYNFDFDYQFYAIWFFNYVKKLKEHFEVKYIIL